MYAEADFDWHVRTCGMWLNQALYMKRINIFALVGMCLLLAFLVGCEKLEVPTLDAVKVGDGTELPENKPSP